MYKMIQRLKDKLHEKLSQKGQGMVEYAIIIAVVAIIAVAVLGTGNEDENSDTLTGAVKNAFVTAKDKINDAATGTTGGNNDNGNGNGNNGNG